MGLKNAWETFVSKYTEGNVDEAQAFYQTEVWPKLLATWKKSPKGDLPEKPFARSVHTLGTSPEAAVLAALAFRSKEVHLLHTKDTARHLDFVARWSGAKVVGHEVDREDPGPIYSAVRRLSAAGAPLGLDFTGGTKVMSAALAAVGFVLVEEGHPLEVYYVSNDRYEARVRRPVAGGERLIRIPPP